MKKLLMLSLAAASLLPAATLTCQTNVNNFTNGSVNTPLSIACGTMDAGAGFTITSFAVQLVASFQDAIPGTIHSYTVSASGGGSSVGPLSVGPGDFGGSNSGIGNYVAGSGTQTQAGPTVTVNTTNIGAVLDNASVSVFIDYTTAPVQTGIPEPSTMALLGSALVGLGLISRRRK